MVHAPRWNEDGRPGGELNGKLQTKQDEVAAERVVVCTQSGEGTEPMRKIVVVGVVERDSPRAAVKAGRRKDAVGEVVREVGVFFEKVPKGLGKIPVKLGSKSRNRTCRYKMLAWLKARGRSHILD
jgi:hypothetical protein